MRNHVSPGITPGSCFYSFFKSHVNQFFRSGYDRPEDLIIIPPTSEQISYCYKCRNPYSITVSKHGQRFFIHIISMLQAVHASFDRSPRSIHTIRMTHDRKSFLMGNMYHFFYFFCLQRFSCHFAVILKIQKSCRHDLDEICTFFSCLQHQSVKLFEIIKSVSYDFSIMSVSVDCKNRCPIINPVFRGQFCCQHCHSIRITTISYKRNLCFLICPQTLPHGFFICLFPM